MDIPDDVWLLVIETLDIRYYGPFCLDGLEDMKHLSETCRRLRRLILPRLFHSTRLHFHGPSLAFSAITEANPGLLDHVRELWLEAYLWRDYSDTNLCRRDEAAQGRTESLATLLGYSELYLRKLYVILDGMTALPDELGMKGDFSSLFCHLQFLFIEFDTDFNLEKLLPCLARATVLEELFLTTWAYYGVPAIPQFELPRTLRCLSLNLEGGEFFESGAIAGWIVQLPLLNDLTIKRVRYVDSEQMSLFADAVCGVAHRLDYLSLEFVGTPSLEEPGNHCWESMLTRIVRPCSSIKGLWLRGGVCSGNLVRSISSNILEHLLISPADRKPADQKHRLYNHDPAQYADLCAAVVGLPRTNLVHLEIYHDFVTTHSRDREITDELHSALRSTTPAQSSECEWEILFRRFGSEDGWDYELRSRT